ncbi:MAG TPA: flagellar motor protein MotB [Pirellulales bacterium]|nr:flagellar motor protein MotB [Pirellulales bacterium]
MSGKCPECEEGLPEWIMSYADMITILMAFFVVMYSMAGSKDSDKEEAVMHSLRHSLGPFQGVLGRFLPKSKLTEMGAMPPPSDRETRDRQPALRAPPPTVPRVPPGQPLANGGLVYFDEGSTDLSEENQHQLLLAVETLRGKPQRIEIRGHSSRRPLPDGSPYRDHWDLAYARCRETMRFLVEHGIDADRIRLGVAPQATQAQAGNQPLLLISDSWVEIFTLNEFTEHFRERGILPTPLRAPEEKKRPSGQPDPN